MEPKILWLLAFVLLYWAYCIFWGIKSAMTAKTASDYFIAGRRLSLWVFVLAATATSFSGWTFMGHPGLVYRDGFQYAYASFYTITIPFTGVLFLKRQWIAGQTLWLCHAGRDAVGLFPGGRHPRADRAGRVAVLDPLSRGPARCFRLPVQRPDRRADAPRTRDVDPVAGRADLCRFRWIASGGLCGHPAMHPAGTRHRHHRPDRP